MAGKRTAGIDLGLDKPAKPGVLGSPPGEIDGTMNQGIEGPASGADVDPAGGSQSGQHPHKTQSKIMRFFG